MDRVVTLEKDETVLEAAMKAGIHINASCGGNGVCGKCRIAIRSGRVDSSPDARIVPSDYENGVRSQ